ncbi:unnamed protein product [Protopolystoma xenopodis]|uniref:Uncharacterized protein n=1 Tax=Protopolystoma xenopodis TaxID=117903 RepID=A0A3S4ZXE8_9PLAT|nr:unnamed protein product [Protopolystoma xenopodis]
MTGISHLLPAARFDNLSIIQVSPATSRELLSHPHSTGLNWVAVSKPAHALQSALATGSNSGAVVPFPAQLPVPLDKPTKGVHVSLALTTTPALILTSTGPVSVSYHQTRCDSNGGLPASPTLGRGVSYGLELGKPVIPENQVPHSVASFG